VQLHIIIKATDRGLSLLAELKPRSLFNRAIQESYFGKWVVAGTLIGVIAGIGATIFYLLIELVTNSILGSITGFYPPNPAGEAPAPAGVHPVFLLVPISVMVGGLVAGILVYHFAPEAEGHGTDAAIEAFHRNNGFIRRRIPIVKTIASAFTIGSGGSAGREGPTAQVAAGFGSFIGNMLKLPVKDRRIAVAAGIGAGIGSIFKSPFGGAILSSEILYSAGDFEAAALIPSFIASPIGYVIFTYFTGFTPIFGNSVNYSFVHPQNLLIYAMLGLLCGLFGKLYSTTFYSVRSLFESLKVSKYFRPMIGALVAGIIGIFFPEVLGLGYGFLQYLIDGKMYMVTTDYFALPLFVTLVLLIFLKIFATSLTIGSGGSGGVFAPALGIGGFVGASLWMAVNALLPGWIPIPAPLVIVGMMALFAGVGRAPIAVILMVSEMTGTLNLLAPSMVAVVIAYFVCGSKYTIYRSQVPTRGDSPAHRGEYNIPLLERITVGDAMNPKVASLSQDESVGIAHQRMLDKGYRGIPIVESGKVVGIVTMSDVLRVPREQMASTALKSVMTKNVRVAYPDETLHGVLKKMTINEIGRLPVVERNTGQLLGIITRTDFSRAYERVAEALSSSEPVAHKD